MSGVADIVNMEEERSKRAPLVSADYPHAGAMLQAAREAMGFSLEDVSTATNIKPSHLKAIEEMDLTQLPAAPFTTGFVKAYASHVELPVAPLVERFREEAGWVTSTQAPKIEIKQPQDLGPAREMSLLAVIAIIVFILWAAWQVTRPGTSSGPVDLDGYPITERPTDAPAETYSVANELPENVLSKQMADMAVTMRNTTLDQMTKAPTSLSGNQETAPEIERGAENVGTAAVPENILPEETESLPDMAANGAPENVAQGSEADVIDNDVIDNNDATNSETANLSAEDLVNGDIATSETVADRLNAESLAVENDPAIGEEILLEDNVADENDTGLMAGVAAPRIGEPSPVETFTPAQPVIVAAVPVTKISPVYPNRCSRRAGPREEVTVGYDISPAGRVINARIISSTNKCFNRAAMNAIGRWRFQPATKDGVPVSANGRATNFAFALE